MTVPSISTANMPVKPEPVANETGRSFYHMNNFLLIRVQSVVHL